MKYLEYLKKWLNHNNNSFFVVSLLLFLIILPLSLKVNFMQNDDWVYYKMVKNFMSGIFVLDSVSAPTFYLQGFLGAIFALFFGISHLPVLTLIFSVLNFYIVCVIIREIFKKSVGVALLGGLLLFLNPFHIYSIFGFMTENYFLFVFLLSIYFFLKFRISNDTGYLVCSYIFSSLSLLIRQTGLVLSLALSLYFLVNKKYKQSSYGFLVFLLNFCFYQFLFPKTPEMFAKPLAFNHLFNFSYTFSLVYGVLIVLTAVLLPLIILYILNNFSKKRLFILITVFLAFFVVLNRLYAPQKISWGEFPYFENTFERTGFFPRSINGTKYHFIGIYDLYKYWDIVSKVLLVAFLSVLLVYKRKDNLNFFIILGACYTFVILLSQTFYDRYILVLVPLFLLFLIENVKENKFSKLLLGGFCCFLAFYMYQFSMDFVLTNNYVWNKAKTLNISKSFISAGTAWKFNNNVAKGNELYEFSYDNPKIKNSEILVEERKINFLFNFFVEPRIFLYKKN